MPKRAAPTKLLPCLGWCGEMHPSKDAGDRYCKQCRPIKEAREKTLSKQSRISGSAPSDIAALFRE